MKHILLSIIFSLPLIAIPRFSVENGVSCNLCHVNPTGAGLRNDYGTTLFSTEELPMEKGTKLTNEDYTGMIVDHLRFGADLRFQVLSHTDNQDEPLTAYFPMQGDLYGNLSVSKGVEVYVKHDLLRQEPEFWTTLPLLPNDGYIRIGRFIPTFGLRLDDHTTFTRGGNLRLSHGLQKEGMPFSPYAVTPGIIEAGMYISDVFVTLSTSNKFATGSESGYGFSESLDEKNLTFRGEFSGSVGSSTVMLGYSFMKEGDFQLSGIFGGASFNKFTWIGEVDFAISWTAEDATSVASFSELSYQLIQGIHLTTRYELFDEDIELKENALSRLTFGTDIFPFSFFEIKLQGRFTTISGSDENPNPEYILQFHTWF